MLLGYMRTSTLDQEAGFEAQRRELKAHGCSKLYAEQVSSVAERPELERLLAFVRPGDVVVVTSLDRLARSMRDLLAIKDRVIAAEGSLRILGMGLDTASATGELILNVLGSVAEFERKRMLERQREGIAKAKADGKYVGRQPTARRQRDKVLKLKSEGKRPVDIMRELGISRASVWRILSAG